MFYLKKKDDKNEYNFFPKNQYSALSFDASLRLIETTWNEM